MKKYIAIVIVCFSLIQCMAVKMVSTPAPQKKEVYEASPSKPKLVVGVVVDQMRYDYLAKFYNKYGDGGFKRLINYGYNLKNAHLNYIPTYTAVGHASIYTGTTPSNHGIISNNWFDKFEKKSIYCVDDSNYKTVGAESGGDKSPFRLLATTVTDQLKLAQNMKSKTISVAIKDRSAIIPAGHTANGAYWFKGENLGKFISSTFYMDKLPNWVDNFNNSSKVDAYLNEVWDTYYPIETYTETLADNNEFEGLFTGKDTPTFPYNLKELRKYNNNFSLIKSVPAGNSITTDFALAAIKGESLGKSAFTDFLAISYSSTDYIGHQFGVSSKEIEDTYIRLDKELEILLNFLDTEIGNGNYTLFLTADHAAVQVPSYLKSLNIPSGYFDNNAFKAFVNKITLTHFNATDLVENISNYQIFLNKERIRTLGLNSNQVAQVIAEEVINFENVYKSVTAHTLQTTNFNSGILQLLQNGYNQKFSGDVLIIPNPSTISHSKTGTTHGSGYAYDTHIPLLFYGNGIKKGTSTKYYPITDIASTLSNLLNITEPNTSTGRTIIDLIK